MEPLIPIEQIHQAKANIQGVSKHTPLLHNFNLSERYKAQIHLKREDMQTVRSYKIRGAYNKMAELTEEERQQGVICASAGNHAQGVAYACNKIGIKGTIVMPSVTPLQKINKVRTFGKDMVEIILEGDAFDDANAKALEIAAQSHQVFIPPFNDLMIIAGQGTIGLEVLEDSKDPIDYIFVPIGGGGLISGLGSYIKQVSAHTKIIGVESSGAPAMYESLKAGHRVKLEQIDPFADGVAVKEVGEITFEIGQKVIDDMVLVPEGAICSTILQLYNEEGIIVEPAGALTIAALEQYQDKIIDKNVVCIVSGSNNDITRTEEIKERALLYEGLKHYFVIRFPQRSGALREFLNNVLGPGDDITHFEYTKKHNRESGPALVGIRVSQKSDYENLLKRMHEHKIEFQTINDSGMLYDLLI